MVALDYLVFAVLSVIVMAASYFLMNETWHVYNTLLALLVVAVLILPPLYKVVYGYKSIGVGFLACGLFLAMAVSPSLLKQTALDLEPLGIRLPMGKEMGRYVKNASLYTRYAIAEGTLRPEKDGILVATLQQNQISGEGQHELAVGYNFEGSYVDSDGLNTYIAIDCHGYRTWEPMGDVAEPYIIPNYYYLNPAKRLDPRGHLYAPYVMIGGRGFGLLDERGSFSMPVKRGDVVRVKIVLNVPHDEVQEVFKVWGSADLQKKHGISGCQDGLSLRLAEKN